MTEAFASQVSRYSKYIPGVGAMLFAVGGTRTSMDGQVCYRPLGTYRSSGDH